MNNSMPEDTRVKVLKEVEEQEKIITMVMNGESIYCPKCNYILYFKGPKSGVHPGIYCGNGCTEILLSMEPHG